MSVPVTHAASSLMQERLSGQAQKDILSDYFNRIEKQVQYSHWYFGHYHADADVDEKHTILYHNIVRAGENAADDLGKTGEYRIGKRVFF